MKKKLEKELAQEKKSLDSLLDKIIPNILKNRGLNVVSQLESAVDLVGDTQTRIALLEKLLKREVENER